LKIIAHRAQKNFVKFAYDRSRFILAARSGQTIYSGIVPQVEICAGAKIFGVSTVTPLFHN
jgi:hypothetical protein